MTVERTHVAKSAEPIVLYAREQKATPSYKPLGFWYEVDGDWRRWCAEAGQAVWIDDYFLHRLTLGDERLIRLTTAAALDSFTDLYGARGAYPYDADAQQIDWVRVAADYDGIEIAPYIWSRRLELMWYYGWDCASGCIWQPRGASLAVLEPVAVSA